MTTQPTYSKENALKSNPFTGLYKRSVARYYPRTGAFVSPAASVDWVMTHASEGTLVLPQTVNNGSMTVVLEKFRTMMGKETYDRPLVIKALDKYIARDHDMTLIYSS